ncbi:hypothetical protein D3C76_1425200 [compost metagenome]
MRFAFQHFAVQLLSLLPLPGGMQKSCAMQQPVHGIWFECSQPFKQYQSGVFPLFRPAEEVIQPSPDGFR